MSTLYYDCSAGISGDMNIAAMLSLGLPFNYLQNEIAKLNLKDVLLSFDTIKKNGIACGKFNVKYKRDAHNTHRHLGDIRKIISDSDLSDFVKEFSIKVFENIAAAEAKVHGTTVDKIHFHEVGAIDSIVDIVGAAIAFEYFDVSAVFYSPIELGSGFVDTAHGKLSVPAPAVLELVKGMSVKLNGVTGESATPTGVAILKTIGAKPFQKTIVDIENIGYGCGERDFDIPNILRIMLLNESAGTAKNNLKLLYDTAYIIETNIDDMSFESSGYLMEKLFDEGADDVWFSPIQMKKNRPAFTLSVLCNQSNKNTLINIILENTTTFGVRVYRTEKYMLDRKIKEISTKYGIVKVKFVPGIDKYKLEYEDCKKIAKRENLPISKVQTEILKDINKGNIDL